MTMGLSNHPRIQTLLSVHFGFVLFYMACEGAHYPQSGVVASDDNPPTHWDAVIMALSKSIHGAIFFDRKYWARHSKAGDVLKPVYFSSIIIDDKAQELNKCASKLAYRCQDQSTERL